ncbi:MAG TPA: ATP-binding protein [Polyangiaceae bacterium]|nr:ATP-binding protein [Polyangiaceae bacterium]
MTAERERERQATGQAWRDVLLQRLLVATTPLITLAVLAVVCGFHAQMRLLMSLLLPLIPLLLLATVRRKWPFELRAAVLIGSFVFAVFLGYATVGFAGNVSLVAATAVVLCGLFFGRRRMIVLIGVLALAPILSGAARLNGAVSTALADDLSLADPIAWLRTTTVAILLWVTLGATVTFVVERVEASLASTKQALADLRAEQVRREQAEQQRKQVQEAAVQAQKLELVGRLASATAHDFNNLLAVVGGWADLVLAELPNTPDNEEARVAVTTAMQQGRDLTRQLLTMARQEQRRVSRVCLENSAAIAVQMLARVLPSNVTLSFQQASSVHVEADVTELQQVLFNLVLNARDAMPEGGTIQVTSGIEILEAPREVVGGLLPPGRWAVLRIADSGPGIDDAIREQIFELFFTTKPEGVGTGLGLATVLRIAQTGGGGVALDSAAERGCSFSVYLPCAP